MLRDPENGGEWGSYCSAACQSLGENRQSAQMSSLAWSVDTPSADTAGPNGQRIKLVAPGTFEVSSTQADAVYRAQ